jgi:hypothetical protein
MQGSKNVASYNGASVPKNVSQHKIIECLGVKPISNTTVLEVRLL